MTQNPVHAKKKEDGKKIHVKVYLAEAKPKQRNEEEKKIQVRLNGLKA